MTVLAVITAVLATSFLSGVFGMVGGLILMGFLLALLPVPAAMALHAVTQMAANGWRAVLWARYALWRIVPLYLLGAGAAFVLFAMVAVSPPKAAVYLALGLVPFAAMLVPTRLAPDVRQPGAPFIMGFIVMALHVMAGVSGALLDMFFVRTELDRRQIVATKALTQTLGHLLKLIYFTWIVAAPAGEGGDAVPFLIYAVAVATALLGTSLARFVLERIDNAAFLRWSRRLVLAIGGVYMARGFYLLLA